MSNYNFYNFDDHEFEILCRDLINKEQSVNIKSNHGLDYKHILNYNSYKRGKDQGIDLIFEKDNIKVVGQVKLSRSNFQELFTSIKRKINGITELDKVEQLNPTKYLFITSTPLSHRNKEQLIEHFSPFIKSTNDVYGKEDLNKLIAQFSSIEERFVKLYFSSPLVLKRLWENSEIEGSNFTKTEIQDQLNMFVQTSSYPKALNIIKNENLLIIKGLPGVGKTTLAKLLSLYYIEKGYQFVEIFSVDNQIESMLDNDIKRIFYYDDFLGSNSLVFSDALKNEDRLKRFIRRINQKTDKALILTSRTNIIKDAILQSEKLKRVFNLVSKFELDISSLHKNEKYSIIKNHFERNQIDLCTKRNNSFIQKLINHDNFSPRLIEFICNSYKDYSNNFKSFSLSCLNYPSEIWSHAYRNQINLIDRLYINHLFLFGNSIEEKIFKDSFNNRINYEVKNNNYQSVHREYKNSTTKLDETFIRLETNLDYLGTRKSLIKFINPSIVDFLIQEIRDNLELIKNSIISFDNSQLLWTRFNHKKKELLNLFNEQELNGILMNHNNIKYFPSPYEKIELFKTLTYYFDNNDIYQLFKNEIMDILNRPISNNSIDLDSFIDTLELFYDTEEVSNLKNTEKLKLVDMLFNETYFKHDFNRVIKIMNLLNIRIDEYLKRSQNLFDSKVKHIMTDAVEQFIYENKENVITMSDVEELYKMAYNHFANFFYKINIDNAILTRILDDENWEHHINYLKFKNNDRENLK